MQRLRPFTVYAPRHTLTPQLRDSAGSVVAVFPTTGGQYATAQGITRARRLAHTVKRMLNGVQ